MRYALWLLAVIALTGCRAHRVATAEARPAPVAAAPVERIQPSLALTDIDANDERARFTFTLTGTPHTADRIDTAILTLTAPIPGCQWLNGEPCLMATDIDGVDFRRYFQWEDEGVITLEIDFPPLRAAQPLRLELTTPRSPIIYQFPVLKEKH